MLRYLIWRLRFEACNIRRLFGHGEDRVHYLAFGANLSDAILRERRISTFASRPFTLRDHGLRFDHPAPWADCGYASAEPAPGESVHGFLYTLSARDAERMDYFEVVPVLNRYRRSVIEQDGLTLYFYQTNRSTPGLKPTEEYLGFIVDGLQAHPDVADSYLEQMKSTRTAIPGAMVASYHAEPTGRHSSWQQQVIDSYNRFSLWIFIKFLYSFSPTALFIKQKSDTNSNN